MIKILSIGNSFSQDATTYLHDLLKYTGIESKVVNLYIGGCSLFTHWENVTNDLENYEYEINGVNTGAKISIKQALLEEDWDFVTTQQASHDSGIFETYFPYISNLFDYVKELSPNSRKLLHQTWAYEIDSDHEAFMRYNRNQMVMYNALKSAYEKTSAILNLDLIPCGDVIQGLRETVEFDYANGGKSLCRDGYHMHTIWGRYALAATWYEVIFQKSILDNNYVPPDIDKDEDAILLNIIKSIVHKMCTV